MAKIHNLMLSFFFFNNVALKAKSTISVAHNKESINQSINQSLSYARQKRKETFHLVTLIQVKPYSSYNYSQTAPLLLICVHATLLDEHGRSVL